jgi:hypothetical protein
MSSGIPLGGERKVGKPSIKLADVGDHVDVAIANIEVVPAYVFGTNERALTKSGQPKTQDKVTVLVLRPGNALIGDSDADGNPVNGPDGARALRPVREGDVGVIYFEGQDRWDPDLDKTRNKGDAKSWSGAKDDLGRQVNVGDMMRWIYEREQPGKAANPRKIRVVKLRPAKPEEQPVVDRCVALYRELTAVTVGAATGGEHTYADEEPF